MTKTLGYKNKYSLKLFLFWLLLCGAAILLTVLCSIIWKKFTSK